MQYLVELYIIKMDGIVVNFFKVISSFRAIDAYFMFFSSILVIDVAIGNVIVAYSLDSGLACRIFCCAGGRRLNFIQM